MATTNKLFSLESGNADDLAVSSSAASLDVSALNRSGSEDTVRLTCNVDVYVTATVGAATAVSGEGTLLPSGTAEAFAIAPDVTHINAVSASSGTLNVVIGKGA